MYDIKGKFEYRWMGLSLSVLLHVFFIYKLYANSFDPKQHKKVIYSVSLEGSLKKGGLAQVPDPKQDKQKVAPPKLVQEKEKQKEKKKEPVKKIEKPIQKTEEKKEEKKVEKKTEEQVIKPTPKPTPKPKKEEPKKEEKKETEKPTPKATPKPKKEEKPKDQPTPSKKVEKKTEKKPEKKEVKKKEELNYESALQKYLGESTNAGGKNFGSAGNKAGNGFGGGKQKPPAWFRYKNALEASVKSGWYWHDQSQALLASVSFKISKTGEIFAVQIELSSGNKKYDDSVLRAVRKASPVAPPPEEFYVDFEHVIMDFIPSDL